MPIYDYKCRDCGKISEIFLRSLNESVKCPECGSENMEKLISASYAIKMEGHYSPGTTCCGRTERCDSPPCSTGGVCRRE
jgi:putative FmdB family regulatory protein